MSAQSTPVRAVKGRGSTVPVTLSLDRHAYELLREMAPSRKTYGVWLSSLVYAEHARREERVRERERVAQEILGGCEASTT